MRAPRVLIVDDDDDVCAAVADAVRATGIVVLTARSRDALAVLRQFRVDLIVVDVELGDRSCLAFLDSRLSDPLHAEVVAMYVSASTSIDIARAGHGSQFYVPKQAVAATLISAIVNAALLAMPMI